MEEVRPITYPRKPKVDVSLADTLAGLSILGALLLFIVSISSPSWVILDGGAYVGVWKLCLVLQGRAEWDCRSYKEQPDFARASQTFLIIALLCHFACLLIMAIYTSITITCLNKTLTVICLCLITFSAGCMTLMGTIVMGVKAQDYLESLKLQNMRVINNLPSLIDVEITGPIGVGWSLILSIISALFTLIAFVIWFLEYQILKATELRNSPVL